MKKFVLLLLLLSFTASVQAATFVGNGTLFVNNQPIYQEKLTTLKRTNTPPVRLDDMNLYYVPDKHLTTKQNKDDLLENQQPIQHVVNVNHRYVMTKFYYRTQFNGVACGGGRADLLQLWSYGAKEKLTLVTNDIVSSAATAPIAVVGQTLYWAKVTNHALGNFTIMTAKGPIVTNVADMLVINGEVYYIKQNKLHALATKKAVPFKQTLLPKTQCDAANYTAFPQGLITQHKEKDHTRFTVTNFTTKKTTTFSNDKLEHLLTYNDQAKAVLAITKQATTVLYDVITKKTMELPFKRNDFVAADWSKRVLYYTKQGALATYRLPTK